MRHKYTNKMFFVLLSYHSSSQDLCQAITLEKAVHIKLTELMYLFCKQQILCFWEEAILEAESLVFRKLLIIRIHSFLQRNEKPRQSRAPLKHHRLNLTVLRRPPVDRPRKHISENLLRNVTCHFKGRFFH